MNPNNVLSTGQGPADYEGFVHEVVVEVWRVRLHGAWWRRFTKEGRRHWRGEREARVRDKVWEWGMLWKQRQRCQSL